jgi:hypothetical protein
MIVQVIIICLLYEILKEIQKVVSKSYTTPWNVI